jgi:acyl-CoA synthetase (NDP forming)
VSADRARLHRAFHPRVVAVIGDKRMNGFLWLRALGSFQGKLYSVQIDPDEIVAIEALGVRNVTSLLDLPEPVDYAIVAVPRAAAPRIVADCVRARVNAATLFTAGFSETGDREGERLEREVSEAARAADLLLIGPNCMGLANPGVGLCNFPGQLTGEAAAGHVAFVGQSGTHTISFLLRAPARGIGISKAASIGNSTVVDAADFLEYLCDDPDTSTIALYLEGVRDGRRFLEIVRRVAAVKPVVVWKGGQHEPGRRAIFSHTAALATSATVWRGLLRQSGAVEVASLEELIDVVAALQNGRAPAGGSLRAGLIAMTGGPSVAITDAFTRAGWEVPLLSEDSYRRLGEFFNVVGGSFRNPLDAGSTIAMGFRIDNLARLLDVLDVDTAIDVIALDLGSGLAADRWREMPVGLRGMIELLGDFAARSRKPLAVIVEPAHREGELAEIRVALARRRVFTVPSAERAAVALRKLLEFSRARGARS